MSDTKEPAQLAYEAFHARADKAAAYPAPSWEDCGPVGRNNWRSGIMAAVPALVGAEDVNPHLDALSVDFEDESPPEPEGHAVAAPANEEPS